MFSLVDQDHGAKMGFDCRSAFREDLGTMKAIKGLGFLLILAGVGAAVSPNINVVAGLFLALIGYGLYCWGTRKEKDQ